MILQRADSLKLTREQADSLATLSHLFAMYADSMWTRSSKYLDERVLRFLRSSTAGDGSGVIIR